MTGEECMVEGVLAPARRRAESGFQPMTSWRQSSAREQSGMPQTNTVEITQPMTAPMERNQERSI